MVGVRLSSNFTLARATLPRTHAYGPLKRENNENHDAKCLTSHQLRDVNDRVLEAVYEQKATDGTCETRTLEVTGVVTLSRFLDHLVDIPEENSFRLLELLALPSLCMLFMLETLLAALTADRVPSLAKLRVLPDMLRMEVQRQIRSTNSRKPGHKSRYPGSGRP